VIGRWHLPVDELRLSALPPRRHHAIPGDGICHLRAVIRANDVQTQVDSRGQAGGGEHVAVVDEQHILVEQHVGMQAPHVVGEARTPVVFGWVFASHQLGAGRLRDLHGTYDMAFYLAAVLCFVAVALCAKVRNVQVSTSLSGL
jgi:hypothetical protein